KRWKKDLAWWAYQRNDLARARSHHATAELEAENVKRLRLGVPVCVVPNGVDAPEACRKREYRQNHRKVALFLGRIHPKKGLPMLIEAWGRVRPDGWVLQIAGPDEYGHRKDVEKAVLAADLGDTVSFDGLIEGDEKERMLLNADL